MRLRFLLILILLAAACSDTTSVETTAGTTAPAATTTPIAATSTTSPATTTTTVVPSSTTLAESPEAAIARDYVEATLGGDAERWRALVADDAVFRDGEDLIPLWDPLSEYAGALTPDFNGDGQQTLGDQLLRDVSVNGAQQAALEDLTCTGTTDRMQCTIAASDVFYLTSGLLPRPWTLLLRINGDGLVEEIRNIERDTNFADELAGLGRDAALLEYETWVFTNQGSSYGGLFGPAGPIYTVESIAVHAQLIPQWQESRSDPRTAPAAGDSILLQRSTPLGPSLWRIDSDGSGLLPLITFDKGRDPSWSPDRTRVVYEIDDEMGSIAVAAADGTGGEILLRGIDPAWLPDGTGIVYAAATDGGLTDLYRFDLATGDSTRLTETSDAGEKTPDVSDDGARIVFGTGQGNNSACSVLDVDTGEVTPLGIAGAARCVWRPGVSEIAYYAFDDAGNADVWIVEWPRGEPRRLTTDPGLDIAPAFSPDGSLLIYSSEANDSARALNLWIVDPDGGDPRQVTQTETADVFADWG